MRIDSEITWITPPEVHGIDVYERTISRMKWAFAHSGVKMPFMQGMAINGIMRQTTGRALAISWSEAPVLGIRKVFQDGILDSYWLDDGNVAIPVGRRFIDPEMMGMDFGKPILDRDELRELLIKRQKGLCICGGELGQNAAVHEAGVKRSDLPGDKRVFCAVNCVAVHQFSPCGIGSHERKGNTRVFDDKCIEYLRWCYTPYTLALWLDTLQIKTRTARMRKMVGLQ